MKTPEYKTLLYMQGLGAPVDELIQARQYNAIKRNIEALTDYELMYYHCKLLKMPISTYDRAGLIMAVFHNILTEYEAMQEDRMFFVLTNSRSFSAEKRLSLKLSKVSRPSSGSPMARRSFA